MPAVPRLPPAGGRAALHGTRSGGAQLTQLIARGGVHSPPPSATPLHGRSAEAETAPPGAAAAAIAALRALARSMACVALFAFLIFSSRALAFLREHPAASGGVQKRPEASSSECRASGGRRAALGGGSMAVSSSRQRCRPVLFLPDGRRENVPLGHEPAPLLVARGAVRLEAAVCCGAPPGGLRRAPLLVGLQPPLVLPPAQLGVGVVLLVQHPVLAPGPAICVHGPVFAASCRHHRCSAARCEAAQRRCDRRNRKTTEGRAGRAGEQRDTQQGRGGPRRARPADGAGKAPPPPQLRHLQPHPPRDTGRSFRARDTGQGKPGYRGNGQISPHRIKYRQNVSGSKNIITHVTSKPFTFQKGVAAADRGGPFEKRGNRSFL